jgi:hypothetical protein
LDDAQVSRRDSLYFRGQRCLQSLDIRKQIWLPSARASVVTTMLIGDFLVDGSESSRGETHYRHGRQLGGTKDIAERYHDGPMHLYAGRFAVSIWLHDYSRPLFGSRHSERLPGYNAREKRIPRCRPSAARDRYALM